MSYAKSFEAWNQDIGLVDLNNDQKISLGERIRNLVGDTDIHGNKLDRMFSDDFKQNFLKQYDNDKNNVVEKGEIIATDDKNQNKESGQNIVPNENKKNTVNNSKTSEKNQWDKHWVNNRYNIGCISCNRNYCCIGVVF